MLDLGMSKERFIEDYWQKKPLLVRNACKDYDLPISPEELGGLACEPGVEARIVSNSVEGKWSLQEGPFVEDDLLQLGERGWCLLVQDVDKILPELTPFKELFRFLPDWRVDDVMVNYGVDESSVGPHVDHYDVFLFQASGEKRWQIENKLRSRADEDFDPEQSLKILSDFRPDEDYLLSKGDLLYLPPRFAHFGIAKGAGMTFSLGFHSPSYHELAQTYLREQLADYDPEDRFCDRHGGDQAHPAEITDSTINAVQSFLQQLQSKPEELVHWLGSYLSNQRGNNAEQFSLVPIDENLSEDSLMQKLSLVNELRRDEASRINFIVNGPTILFFINGQETIFPIAWKDFLYFIASEFNLDLKILETFCKENKSYREFLANLLNEGVFYFVS